MYVHANNLLDSADDQNGPASTCHLVTPLSKLHEHVDGRHLPILMARMAQTCHWGSVRIVASPAGFRQTSSSDQALIVLIL